MTSEAALPETSESQEITVDSLIEWATTRDQPDIVAARERLRDVLYTDGMLMLMQTVVAVSQQWDQLRYVDLHDTVEAAQRKGTAAGLRMLFDIMVQIVNTETEE